jgi:tRNA (guanine9-N1)-methyltransferase
VNQVFEILVKWVETRSWEEALYSVIPKRKFVDNGNTQKDDNGEGEELDDDEDEVDESGRKAETIKDACDGQKAST